MSDRHRILADTDFWSRLEYELSGWFRTSGSNTLGGYWCDGFMPKSARNTKEGVEVQGTAWIEEGRTSRGQFAFVLSIPQKLLLRYANNAVLMVKDIDVERRRLQLALASGTSMGAERREEL